MTIYAGETVRVTVTAKDFDDNVLTDGDVSAAKITITEKDGTIVQAESDLTFDATDQEWFFDWDTTGVASGNYIAKTQFTGSGFDTWEFLRIRLNKNLV